MKHGLISSYSQTNEGVNQVPNAGTSGWTTAPSCRSCRFRPNNNIYIELLEQIAVLKCLVSDFPKRKVVHLGMVIIYIGNPSPSNLETSFQWQDTLWRVAGIRQHSTSSLLGSSYMYAMRTKSEL
jgi:hypothetical protein